MLEDTLVKEVPTIIPPSTDPPHPTPVVNCHPTAWTGRSRGLGDLVKRVISKVLILKRMRVEGSFSFQLKDVVTVFIELNDEDISSSKRRVAPPSKTSTFGE